MKFYLVALCLTLPTTVSSADNICNGLECQKISMPLLDNMKANLRADLDVTEMNNHLKAYINQEVQTAITTTMTDTVQRLVNVKMEEEKQRLDKILKDRLVYAFRVTMRKDKVNMFAKEVVIFDQVSLNDQNIYNESSGKVTCLEDGYYSFSWTFLSRAKKDFDSELVVNGNGIVANIVDNDATSDDLSSSISVVVKLRKGDKVWIQALGQGKKLGAKWANKPCSVFSGFKI